MNITEIVEQFNKSYKIANGGAAPGSDPKKTSEAAHHYYQSFAKPNRIKNDELVFEMITYLKTKWCEDNQTTQTWNIDVTAEAILEELPGINIIVFIANAKHLGVLADRTISGEHLKFT